MATVTGTFKIRRYWLKVNTPWALLNTLNVRLGVYHDIKDGSLHRIGAQLPYVDVNYFGDSDRNLTLMELKCAEYIEAREEITYTVEGDDGLDILDLTDN